MRITCPNCGAQYEVDGSLIPEAGRDVQCSNCGKGWFQARQSEPDEPAEAPDAEAAGHAPRAAIEDVPEQASAEFREDDVADGTVEAGAPAGEAPETRGEDVRAARTQAEAPAKPAPETAPASRSWTDEIDEEGPEPAPAMTAAPRKTDENVLAVLREEAEREIAERRREAEVLESQPDLGLTEPAPRVPSRTTAEATAGAATAAGARRDLLPDIDEINSTLRPYADRAGAAGDHMDEDVTTGRRRGFRLGFGLMILVAAVLIGLYVGAGWLAATFPALEPMLIAYLDWANGLSDWLDGLLAAGVDGMSG